MRQRFVIPGRLDDFNKYTYACRSDRHAGARMKKANQKIVSDCLIAYRIKPHQGAVYITYRFYEKPHGRMRDKSNIQSFAMKVIEDALTEGGIIKDDSWQYIAGYSCSFYRVTENPRIEVEIEDA